MVVKNLSGLAIWKSKLREISLRRISLKGDVLGQNFHWNSFLLRYASLLNKSCHLEIGLW